MPKEKNSATKMPPHDLSAEKSVLGSCLIDPDVVIDIAGKVSEEDFYYPENAKVWSVILKLFEKKIPSDVVTVGAELDSDKSGASVTTAYLASLVEMTPTSSFASHYAKIVKDHAARRRLIAVSSQIVEKSFDSENEVEKVIDEAEGEIFQIGQSFVHSGFIELKDALLESYQDLENLRQLGSGVRGLHTGYDDLDHILAGLQNSNLVILAARPGVGKTSFALNIALHAALNEKVGVAVFSLEMAYKELVDRMLVSTAEVEGWRVKTGRVDAKDMEKITDAMGYLAEAPIMIDDKPGISMMEIRSKARKLKVEKNIGLIVIDYLQLIQSGKNFKNDTVAELTFISQSLKNLARELKVPVIALSQLNRALEHRAGSTKPQLADLRGSGSIEQDADVVMFIYQEKSPDELLDNNVRPMKILVAKHRNGAIGEIDMVFRSDRVKFFSVDKRLADGI